MALRETLSLVISADARGAIKAFDDVGKSADRSLGKTDQSLDRLGGRLQSIGAGAVGVGSVLLFGLGKAAQASEEADKALLRLQNSMQNNRNLAGQSSKQFEDLARSIMGKTAADDDAIVSGQAILAQFGLTAGQIKELTPLVVDYARKMGVDLDTAAKAVGKSVDGTNTTLKRSGIQFNDTSFAADHYRGTVEALRGSVGGFAEQEGATFAGSLERMKNQLANVQEGVGKGAVKAFESLFAAVDKTTGALEGMAPGTQETVGQLATYGAIGLVATGATSSLIGTLIKARENFGRLGAGVKGATDSLGGFRAAAGKLGFATALFAGMVVAAKGLESAFGGNHMEDWAKDLQAASGKATDALVADFTKMQAKYAQTADLFNKDTGRKFFEDLVSGGTQGIATATRLADALAATGVNVDGYREIINRATVGQKQLNADQKTGSQITGEYGDDVEELGKSAALAKDGFSLLSSSVDLSTNAITKARDAAKATEDAHKKLHDTLRGITDPFFAVIDASNRQADANDTVREKTEALNTAIRDFGRDSLEARDAQRELERAHLDAAKSASDLEQAQLDLVQSVKDQKTSVEDAKTMLQRWVDQGAITQESADTTARKLDEIKEAADKLPSNIDMAIKVDTAQAMAALREVLNATGQFAALARETYAGPSGGSVSGPTPAPVFGVDVNPNSYADAIPRYRHGGIHMAETGLIHEGIYDKPMFGFAEPGTGGEAFIPRKGISQDRAASLISTAADWHGMDVVMRGSVDSSTSTNREGDSYSIQIVNPAAEPSSVSIPNALRKQKYLLGVR